MTAKKKPKYYWLLDCYDVMIMENKSKLIYPVKNGVSTIQYYITDLSYFTYFMKLIRLLDTEDMIEC